MKKLHPRLEEFKTYAESEMAKLTTKEGVQTLYELYKKNYQQSMYYLIEDERFIGSMLQEMNFKATLQIPTAGLTYNKGTKNFEIYINPIFFNFWTLEERVGILHHEVLHFVNNHLMRMDFAGGTKEEAKLKNLGADMSINQFIKSLPPGGIVVDEWKLKSGEPFPKWRTSEEYVALIKENAEANEEKMKSYGAGEGEVGDTTTDSHNWEELTEEERKEMASDMKKIVKRTMEKTQYGHDKLPDSIKDLLAKVDVFIDKFNAKKILQDTIKKTVSFSDRENTWKRPNKRYGNFSPGTTVGKAPKLTIYQDTSGSRSTKELNADRKIIEQFLKNGSRECTLALWHTVVYNKKKYKLNQDLNADDIQAGGTCVNPVIEDINKNKPDLAIVLTDGFYDHDGIKPLTETVFIIVDNGKVDHQLSKVCKTLTIKNLK